MAKEAVNPASLGSASAEDKAIPVQLETYDTAGEVIQIDPIVDARVTRKFDKRIVPLLFGLRLLAFIDRSNIGSARIDGLATDLNLGTGHKFNNALTIFYFLTSWRMSLAIGSSSVSEPARGITIIFGIFAAFSLPHTPGHAKFLSEEEKYAATHRMGLDGHGATTSSGIDREKFSWHWVKLALSNWNTTLPSINFFAIITPIHSFSPFFPTIIPALGYTKVSANLLIVPPSMAAFFTVLITTHLSDKYKQRGIFMLTGTSLSIVGYIMLISTGRPLIQ
jgi:hypothetical protein